MNIFYAFTKLRFPLLVMLTVTGSLCFAQQQLGTISGTVTSSDGNGAPYVNLVLKGTNKGATSDVNGKFEIKRITPGSYILVASFVGFDPKEQDVEVRAGENVVVKIGLNETSAELEEIVVRGVREGYKTDAVSSSLRLRSSLLETPQNIQVVTSDVLRDQQVISLSDGLIRNVSGVVRSEHWGDLYTNIKARGAQLQAFRNGFNVVNSFWGPLTEDMSFVDHIEFVKGPAGFMLANGDPAGLYNVVTKKPTGITKGEASMTVGSYGLFRSTLDLDGRLSKDGKLLYRLNFSAQNKNSHRANEYNDRYVIAPVISYQLDEKTKLTLEYNYQRANMSNLGSFYIFSKKGYGTLPVDFTTLPAGTPGNKIDDHSFYVNLQHELSENWKLTAQGSRFIYKQIGASMWPSDTTIYDNGTYLRQINIWDAESKMTMAQVFVNGEETTGSIRHRILAGIDVARKEYLADWGQGHILDTYETPFNPFDPDFQLGIPPNGFPNFDRSMPLEQRAQLVGGLIDQRYSSLYIQDELGFINNQLRLTVALRYTNINQSNYGGTPEKADRVTPRLGLSASLTKQLSVYALFDQAFLPQSIALGKNGKNASPITGNNVEIGFKKDWFGGWNSTLSLYRIVKNGELMNIGSTAAPILIELDQKRAEGIELDIRGTIVNGLNLIANYAYTNSIISEGAMEGTLVPGFAKHTANAWLNYKIQNGVVKGLGFSAGCTYLADRATFWTPAPTADTEIENYIKLDGGLFWEKDKIRITANVFNVLDEYLYSGSYENWMTNGNPDTGGVTSGTYSYQTEAPRNYRIGITYSF